MTRNIRITTRQIVILEILAFHGALTADVLGVIVRHSYAAQVSEFSSRFLQRATETLHRRGFVKISGNKASITADGIAAFQYVNGCQGQATNPYASISYDVAVSRATSEMVAKRRASARRMSESERVSYAFDNLPRIPMRKGGAR